MKGYFLSLSHSTSFQGQRILGNYWASLFEKSWKATTRHGVRRKRRRKRWYRPWDQTNLVLNSIEKGKPGTLLSLMCMFSESNGIKFWSHSFHFQNSSILQARMDPIKMNFDTFQIKNEYHKQLELKKQMKKIMVICLVSFCPSWVGP